MSKDEHQYRHSWRCGAHFDIGRFDFQVHRDFKGAYAPSLENPSIREFEIELSQVDYLDSSALGMMMLLRERVQSAGKTVMLVRPNPAIVQILDIANFNKLFKIL